MNAKRVGAVLGAVAVVLLAACSTTITGVATAPYDVTPFTSTPQTPTRTATKSPSPAPGSPRGSAGLPPEAFAEVRAAGIQGSDSAIGDQLMMACIMGSGSFNKTKQDVVDVLIQMGSRLPPDALMTIVNVAIKYECPELAGKLGG
ncbi:hypothetical protein FZI95_06385 [Mycobacterium sp. CBMA247]|nr:hypothetical protein [Mycolicibacterium sp. CBMA 329]MUL87164.1 hypothetical protein [Mycolicibacterium sp. CBMA 331]MUL98554.1 hypothetical protein [Mycolicibacterium sp. CBMA 334]MUM29626.1 hypothetical protein [Mycolicibacterium sp. CBMA 295]MUM37461.1 hypothetical protein [Mycolicibacterium sp. CBMA 247]MUM43229.1 hypothetical protein [Mycolicibacterium sp. CBMA 294]